ncbi:MAG TPA: gamma carbonic anhydrase family protein [Burkholderiales bacterium]|nr:gamma carbonic anhydrase family protein [Burkholderiales bacterium]
MAVFSLGERRVEFRGEEWFVAPDAAVIGSVVIGNAANIWFKVVIRGDNDLITIGERCNVQDGSVLHTDPGIQLTLGRNVCIGHKVMLHGCTIGEASLIGINSVVMNHATIGRQSIVGANTLIPEGKSFPERVLILGSPGKVVRELRQDEIALIEGIADGYVQRARQFKAELKPQELPPGAR